MDGWLARRNGGGNSVGAVLDPMADKALLVTMYVTLAAVDQMPDWLAILVVFRDLVIVGGVIVLGLIGQPVIIRPLFVSKVNTALQIMLVALTLFLAGFEAARAGAVLLALTWAVAATTLASGAAYVWSRCGCDEAVANRRARVSPMDDDARACRLSRSPPAWIRRSSFAVAPDRRHRASAATRGQRIALVVGAAGGGLAGAATVRRRAGAFRGGCRACLCARPADHAA